MMSHSLSRPPIRTREIPLSPSALIDARWWEELEDDFHRRPERFEMARGDRVRVALTAAADLVVRTVGSTFLTATILPLTLRPDELRASLRDRAFYQPLADSGDPTRLFAEPPPGVAIRHAPPRGFHFRPEDGTCDALTFESPFRPANPRIRERYLAMTGNTTAHARYWRHRSGPRPTIIAVHGYAADPFWINRLFFELPWFYSIGCDVLLFTMPFHGARQPGLSPFSGSRFFGSGMSHINEAFAQAIMDLRVLVRYLLDDVGAPQVGITGLSLGGWTSALMAATEPRLSFSIPNVPVVSLGDLVLQWQPIGAVVLAGFRAMGLSIRDLRRMFAAVSPLSYPSLLPHERLMIIAGAADRMAPPKHAQLLWEHWGRCRIRWFPGNHILHLDRGNYLREMARFMNRIGFLSRP